MKTYTAQISVAELLDRGTDVTGLVATSAFYSGIKKTLTGSFVQDSQGYFAHYEGESNSILQAEEYYVSVPTVAISDITARLEIVNQSQSDAAFAPIRILLAELSTMR